jgi:histone-lysine N-methyltransferase SETDB1
MKCGWSREVTKRTPKGQRNVVYRGPCGRRMRNMHEVHRYLRLTRCALNVDHFCYELSISCFREFRPDYVRNQIEGTAFYLNLNKLNKFISLIFQK